jgi:hypothetical protein
MKRLGIFVITLIIGFAGFYALDKWGSVANNDKLSDSDSTDVIGIHIPEITADMDLDTKLKYWSEHFALEMSRELMKIINTGTNSELNYRVRSLDFDEKSSLCWVEIYTSWLNQENTNSKFFEVVVKTEFNLKLKTAHATKEKANEEFDKLLASLEFDELIEESMIRSLQYLQEII